MIILLKISHTEQNALYGTIHKYFFITKTKATEKEEI